MLLNKDADRTLLHLPLD